MKIINTIYCPATKAKKDDVPRYIVHAVLSRTEANREAAQKTAHEIVNNLAKTKGFFCAATVFFWTTADPVGMVAARASYTYAPRGNWDEAELASANKSFDVFELKEDFFNFCETCWGNPGIGQ